MSRILAFVLVTSVLGCAAAGSGSRQDRTMITTEEIRASSATNLLELVRAERPNWLRTRGLHSISSGGQESVLVYLDNARMGGIAALAEISPTTVQSVRFLEPAAANFRFGSGHDHGVILASTRAPG